ncbi:unnamed protein product [Dovyalis caffra]|uniref:Uncharacterized protein n=1 Tax=Dovyalis caffra TaxID=77055 RepID=A0AAV1R0U5_9ROSI|nr:unnamed protein product [Dovyalis caffra]
MDDHHKYFRALLLLASVRHRNTKDRILFASPTCFNSSFVESILSEGFPIIVLNSAIIQVMDSPS